MSHRFATAAVAAEGPALIRQLAARLGVTHAAFERALRSACGGTSSNRAEPDPFTLLCAAMSLDSPAARELRQTVARDYLVNRNLIDYVVHTHHAARTAARARPSRRARALLSVLPF